MVLKLYAQDMSPPCRSVYVTAAALDLELDIIVIDVWKKQQFSETFLKINPHHKIPTLDDDGTIIWDSQAIITYLVCKYGKDDSFYPNNCKVRAVINQHLFYNASVIFPLARKLILKIARQECIDEVDVLETNKMYESLELSLMNSAWLGGDCVTIADFAINPNHTIPALDDEGTIICDSQAIIIYLVTKYGKDDSFYPNDLKARALINETLFYNACVIFPVSKKLILKISARKGVEKRDVLEINNIYQSLERRLKNSAWLGGDSVTIADFAVSSCVTGLDVIEPMDEQKYPSLSTWIKNIKKLPYFHVNEKGLNDIKELISKCLSVSNCSGNRLTITNDVHFLIPRFWQRCWFQFSATYTVSITTHKIKYTSPPVRAVYLTAAALGLKLELIEINLLRGDNKTDSFLKMNPQHSVPTLDDNGTIIWDSHAIIIYLVSKYGKDKSLYPDDHYKRAVIHQRLHFDSGKAFPAFIRIVMPILTGGVKTIPEDLIQETLEVYELLDKFLESSAWVAGDSVTLADLSLLSSITTLNYLVPIDANKYAKIIEWIKRGEKLPYYHANAKGLNCFD
ncbi:hypothetical protein FQR65_LT05828 [Abscondita terminalis]|nr:hypothetical protein FQR65_LT05828 [Abscondita terminalis]